MLSLARRAGEVFKTPLFPLSKGDKNPPTPFSKGGKTNARLSVICVEWSPKKTERILFYDFKIYI